MKCHQCDESQPCYLSEQMRGTHCVVVGLGGCGSACRKLAGMGLVEGEKIIVLRQGNCLMLECNGGRIALQKSLAKEVEVEPL